jgi:hypothetical protein
LRSTASTTRLTTAGSWSTIRCSSAPSNRRRSPSPFEPPRVCALARARPRGAHMSGLAVRPRSARAGDLHCTVLHYPAQHQVAPRYSRRSTLTPGVRPAGVRRDRLPRGSPRGRRCNHRGRRQGRHRRIPTRTPGGEIDARPHTVVRRRHPRNRRINLPSCTHPPTRLTRPS